MPDINKNDKHDFFFNLAKIANLGNDKNENFECQFFTGNTFLAPFKGAENRFSLSCLVCATAMTQYTAYGKVHWVVLK